MDGCVRCGVMAPITCLSGTDVGYALPYLFSTEQPVPPLMVNTDVVAAVALQDVVVVLKSNIEVEALIPCTNGFVINATGANCVACPVSCF